MKHGLPDQEALLEGALVASGVGLLVGVALLLLGRIRGDAARGHRHREAPPAAGSVPAERHQHVAAVSAR